MTLGGSSFRRVAPYEKVSELAEKMAQKPPLSALAHDLQTLAMKLQQPNLSEQEQQTLIHETLEQVEKQQKKEAEKESRHLLGEASSTLQSLEQQSGRSQQKDSEKGDGVAQSNLSQEGQGEGKQKQSGGDSKVGVNAQRSQDMRQGQSTRGGPQEQGKESQQSQRDGKENQPDPNKSDKDTGKEMTGKTQGGSQEKLGRSRSENTPQGAPPAERFYKPGEQGKEGVKGARYVTVQLPEELAAESKGEGTLNKQTTQAKAYPTGPASNIPLPAHVPDAPAEKQPLPLEYRGIIR
jgi:hypothetical protein